MAMRKGRKKSQLPECYYEGYLEKMSFRDQTSQKLWTCLCGNTLFFFSDKRDSDYLDKVDLTALISVEDDDNPDNETYSTRFTVQLRSGSLKFIASSTEARELWKGFILSVGQLSVPSSLNLLPGQIHMMGDAVHKEQERQADISPSAATDCTPPNTIQSDMPSCFFEVPRLEAELLLEREASKGNLLMRPGRSLNSYAITIRMESTGAIFKHYRVLCDENEGFYIALAEPVFGKTLQDLVDHFVKINKDSFKPLVIEAHYDDKICFISSDKESGERTLQPLLASPAAAPHKHVDEKLTTTEAEAGGEQKSSLADMEYDEKESRDSSAVASSLAPPRRILMPPSPFPRKGSVASPANNQGDSRKLRNTEEQRRLLMPAISELKLKLGQKLKLQD
ncbi:signal-transducing adaptor protein 1 isoform X2 [Austrofundulus limnaeus]|uniref:Signal-transducing adaptor protein 1 isoform X2 n=1 Tax=Austrofundulus limnaeus TaxID=52670 RepID=A0A2I4CVN9_AUSLI|nr:PREDICTED: signal-transducing adaptor protein 1-like isoform X2 [Austrofundulus limnaeus]